MSAPGRSAAVAGDFLQALDRRDWSTIAELCAPGYVHHAPRVAAASLPDYIATAKAMFTAFPDMTATIEALIEAADWVTARYTAHGTHQAPFAGIPATGRPVSFTVLGLIHVQDGKLTEGWYEFDTGAITQQLAAPAGTRDTRETAR
jgi:steroid delta-isomerase-like uncharacterized protein